MLLIRMRMSNKSGSYSTFGSCPHEPRRELKRIYALPHQFPGIGQGTFSRLGATEHFGNFFNALIAV